MQVALVNQLNSSTASLLDWEGFCPFPSLPLLLVYEYDRLSATTYTKVYFTLRSWFGSHTHNEVLGDQYPQTSYRMQVLSNHEEEPGASEYRTSAVMERRPGSFPLKPLANVYGGLVVSSMFRTAYLLHSTDHMNKSHLFSTKDIGHLISILSQTHSESCLVTCT